jgi:FK506-binding protein 1
MTSRTHALLSVLLLGALVIVCCACSEPWSSGYDAATAPPTPETGGAFTIPSGREGVPPIEVDVVAKGDGRAPAVGESVTLHYIGTFLDGKEFGNSRKRGKPLEFELGADGIIRGWHLVVERMHVGDRWTVKIPSPLAYGSRGSFGVIAANTDLVFDMELIGVR